MKILLSWYVLYRTKLDLAIKLLSAHFQHASTTLFCKGTLSSGPSAGNFLGFTVKLHFVHHQGTEKAELSGLHDKLRLQAIP